MDCSGPVDLAAQAGMTFDWITSSLLRETRELWQPCYSEALTSSDAREMLVAVTFVFGDRRGISCRRSDL